MKTIRHSIFLFLFLNIFAQVSFAQNSLPQCASDEMMKNLIRSNPGFQNKTDEVNNLLYNIISEKQNHLRSVMSTVVYTIPVVVHIMHNFGPENITDAEVMMGINNMNDAFRNRNAYDSLTGVDVGIEFCLAQQDEFGVFTTGVTRTATPLTNMTMETDDLTLKNLVRWDPTKYLNIWVVNSINSVSMGPGVAGYAFFPSAYGTSQDGIVNEVGYFWSTTDNSKVVIHEVGHYLGLYHTFEGGCTNSNCMLDGDKVCDTPPDNSTSPVTCGNTVNTCATDDDDLSTNNPFRPTGSGGLGDQNDLYIDYMDYGYQACQSVFTAGQKDRMVGVLTGVRSTLLTSMGCQSICTSPITASVVASPGTSITTGTIINFTSTTTGATTYTWKVNGVVQATTPSFAFPFNTPGIYTVTLEASNGPISCTKTVTNTITVTCPVLASFSNTALNIPVGGSVTFTNSSTAATTYSWLIDGTVVASTANLTHTFSSPGQYYVCLQAADATCNNTNCATVIVGNDCSGVSAGADTTICAGETVWLNAVATGFTNLVSTQWQGGTGIYSPSSTSSSAIYTPSATEIAAGSASIDLSTKYTMSSSAPQLMSYSHANNDSLYYVDPATGNVTGIIASSHPEDDYLCLGYDIAHHTAYGWATWSAVAGWYKTNVITGAATFLYNSGYHYFAADYDNSHNILYAVQTTTGSGSAQTLVKVDTATGFDTPIGSLGILNGGGPYNTSGNGINGMAYDPDLNILWGISGLNALYQINITTGNATFVGNTGITGDNISGLAYDFNTHKLYGNSYTYANIYEINKNTAAVVSSHSVAFGLCCITALAYAPDQAGAPDTLYCLDNKVINIQTSPTLDIVGPDSVYLCSAPHTLDAGGLYSSYAWSNGAVTQTTSISSTGTYSVTVSNAAGCQTTDVVYILPSIPSSVSLNLGPDLSLLPGQTAVLDAGPWYSSYLWQNFSTNQTYTAYGAGIYWVTVTDACGITATDTIRITVGTNSINSLSGNPVATLYDCFPNPANGSITAPVYLPSNIESAYIEVFDIIGNKVLASEPIKGRGDIMVSININDIAAGAYTYRLIADTRTIGIKKLLIVR